MQDVLRTPGLVLEPLGRTIEANTEATTVVLAESLSDLGASPAAAIVVLGVHTNDAIDTYRFDVALRAAATRGVAALVIASPEAPAPTSTSVLTAERYGLVLLRNNAPVNIADLVHGLGTALQGSAELALRRAVVTVQRLATRQDTTPAELVAEVARLADNPIDLADRPTADLSFPVGLDDDTRQWVNVHAVAGSARPELVLIGRLLADSLGRSELAERRARDLPVRSRAELLSELLDSTSKGRAELLRRARSLGLPIDGWHLVAWVEPEEGEHAAVDEIAAFAAREELGRVLLEGVRSSGTWHLTRADGALLLVQMSRSEPAPSAPDDAARTVQAVVENAVQTFPKLDLFCGVGSVLNGPTGLINSAAEARAAAGAMRTRSRPNVVTAFDSLGLRRTLVEWYASHTARTAVDAVLAPLDRMGPAKAEAAIRTLQAYLDNHGSLSKAAAELHMHRNSVAYRVDRIFAELDVDLDNPDDWLLLQLACRARAFA